MEETISVPLNFEALLPPPASPRQQFLPTVPETTTMTKYGESSNETAGRNEEFNKHNHHPTYHLYSRFWRDRGVFDVIADEIFWNICVDRVHDWRGSHFDGVLRAWSCGSSTGEEVYSLSMMWEYHYERIRSHIAPLQLQILGTDRSEKAVEASNKAKYAWHSLHDLPKPLYDQYTTINTVAAAAAATPTTATTSKSTNLETSVLSNNTSRDHSIYYPPSTEPASHYTRGGRKQEATVKGLKSKKAYLSTKVTDRCRFIQQDFNETLPTKDGPFDLILARYSVLLYSDNGAEVITNILQQGLLRAGGYLVVGMSDTISPQLANYLQLIPVATNVAKGMWQFLPKDWKPIRVNRSIKETAKRTTVLPTLHNQNQNNHNNNQSDSPVLEDYSNLSQFLYDGLKEIPPTHRHNYITEGSERLLNRLDYNNRRPLHVSDKYLPPIKCTPRDDEETKRWDRTMAEGVFGGETDYYKKEREKAEEKRRIRKENMYVPEEKIDLMVTRMIEFAKIKEERRVKRMEKLWKEEEMKNKIKKRKEKLKRIRQLKRLQKQKKKCSEVIVPINPAKPTKPTKLIKKEPKTCHSSSGGGGKNRKKKKKKKKKSKRIKCPER
jgi:chemotaxis methyl-accepting protein methylase